MLLLFSSNSVKVDKFIACKTQMHIYCDAESIRYGSSNIRKIFFVICIKCFQGVLKDGEKIAVKLLHPLPGLEDSDQQFQNEFDNLVKLRHQNIVHLVGYCYEIQKRYVDYNGRNIFAEDIRRVLCFEYMQKGSLDKYLSGMMILLLF